MERASIISKDRVKKNGEVFTPDEIVNDMINLIDDSMKDIDDLAYIKDTRLEPTCGDGAILVRILDRKLGRVQNIKNSGGNWKEALLYAVASIYGIDITADNIVMSKRRMLEVIENGSTTVLSLADETPVKWQSHGFELDDELRKLVQLILDYNIQCGNSLTGEQYKIYNYSNIGTKIKLNAWDCDIDLVDEKHFFRNQTSGQDKETEGWETQKDTLYFTQWKFENTDYINRQLTFNNYKESMEIGSNINYITTQPLSIYCDYQDPKDDIHEEFDF